MARGSKHKHTSRPARGSRGSDTQHNPPETAATSEAAAPTSESTSKSPTPSRKPLRASASATTTRSKPSPTAAPTPETTENSAPFAIPHWRVLAVCVFLSVWFCWPVLSSGTAFGVNDWDMNLFYAEAARRSVSVHGQMPLWNPWYCGGSPLLANPQSVFLSPLFLFTLFGGSVVGTKIQIAVAQLLGMFGAHLLARRAGAKGTASLLASAVFGLSSVYTLHLATGHATWVSLGFVPYAFLGADAAMAHARERAWKSTAAHVVLSAVSLACVLFSGNAYFFVYTAMAIAVWGITTAATSKTMLDVARVLGAGVAIALIAVGLCAVKLLPMLDFLGRVSQYEAKDQSGATLDALRMMLFVRDQGMTAQQFEGMQYRWWEYGAYVGFIPMALALLGVITHVRSQWRWLVIALLFGFIAMGVHGPVWPLLRSIKQFEGLRVPSRTIVYVVLAIGVFASVGLSWLADHGREKSWWSQTLANWGPLFIVAIVVADMFSVTRPVLEEAFTLPAVDVQQAGADAPFRHVFGHKKFETFKRYSNTYDHVLRNEGMVNCYERLHLPTAVEPAMLLDRRSDPSGHTLMPNPKYQGETWLISGQGTASIQSFSPNRITVTTRDVSTASRLVLNQNFDPGWKAIITANNTTTESPAVAQEGRVSVDVPASTTNVVFVYKPAPFARGVWLSVIVLLGVVGVGGWLLRERFRKPATTA